jgi:hypothetical protein
MTYLNGSNSTPIENKTLVRTLIYIYYQDDFISIMEDTINGGDSTIWG